MIIFGIFLLEIAGRRGVGVRAFVSERSTIKNVRTHCYCASLLRTQIHTPPVSFPELRSS